MFFNVFITRARTHTPSWNTGAAVAELDIAELEAAARTIPLGRKVPLDQAFSVPPPPSTKKVDSSVRQTTLENGVRVVSKDTHQPVSSIGVFIDAGSVCETPEQAGATLFCKYRVFLVPFVQMSCLPLVT